MTELEHIVEEVIHLYRTEDYHAAHELAWSKAQEIMPDARLVAYLSFSSNRQHYRELIYVLRKYRVSVEIKKIVAEFLVKDHPSEAWDICTGLLNTDMLLERDEIDIRWTRIRATGEHFGRVVESFHTLEDDFISLWDYGDKKGGLLVPYTRRRLLRVVAQLSSPGFIPMLKKLSINIELSGTLRAFFEQKASELGCLEELTLAASQ